MFVSMHTQKKMLAGKRHLADPLWSLGWPRPDFLPKIHGNHTKKAYKSAACSANHHFVLQHPIITYASLF